MVIPAIQVRSLPRYCIRPAASHLRVEETNDGAMEEEEEPVIASRGLVFQSEEEGEERDDILLVRKALEGNYTTEEREQRLDRSIRQSSMLY